MLITRADAMSSRNRDHWLSDQKTIDINEMEWHWWRSRWWLTIELTPVHFERQDLMTIKIHYLYRLRWSQGKYGTLTFNPPVSCEFKYDKTVVSGGYAALTTFPMGERLRPQSTMPFSQKFTAGGNWFGFLRPLVISHRNDHFSASQAYCLRPLRVILLLKFLGRWVRCAGGVEQELAFQDYSLCRATSYSLMANFRLGVAAFRKKLNVHVKKDGTFHLVNNLAPTLT